MTMEHAVNHSRRANRFAGLAFIAAVAAGLAAFLSNADRIGSEIHKACRFANFCA